MISGKELLKEFKNAPWKSEQELSQFLSTVPVQALDLRVMTGMLEILCNRRLSTDGYVHTLRCKGFGHLAAKIGDKSMFVPYVKALKAGDARVRSLITPLIAQVNNYEEHGRLCELLRSTELDIRRAAVAALKAVGGRTILVTLSKMLQEKDFPGRSEVMDLAITLAPQHSVPILELIVKNGDGGEKIKALGHLGDEQLMQEAPAAALRAILIGLSDDNEKVVVQAVSSFANLCNEDDFFEFIAPFLDSDKPSVVLAAVAGLRSYSSPRAIAALGRKLRSGPDPVRLEVLSALEQIGNEEVLPPLVEALGHRRVAVRNRAGEVLAKLSQAGKLDVARVIIWLLRSSDVNVRRMAVELARSVRDPDGTLWPKLLSFLRDEDWWVRERVMDALVEMAGKKLTPHMVGFLSDPNDVLRRFAVDVLIRLEDPQALGALVNTAREDTDWWAREKAVEAIALLRDERSIPYIVDLMSRDQEVQLACVHALTELDARSTAPYVAQLLAAPDPDIRTAAIKALHKFDATEFADQIKPMMGDPDPRVVRNARELLLHFNVSLASETIASTRDKAVSFLDKMLLAVSESEGDDLLIASGRPPYVKRMGKMRPLSSSLLSSEQVKALLTPHLSLEQVEQLQQLKDVDFSYEVATHELRFRANVFQQRGGLSAVFRIIKSEVPRLEELGVPEVVMRFGDLKYGLVLVGGPTGSGKSTTLAALIDYINRTSARHVIALEDPIEAVHRSQKGLVNQREIGTHTHTFGAALRSTLREDPDVILVGEMRDLDTIEFAVTAAETGHLVFGTVHTVSADTSIDRVINAFPAGVQDQVRSTLAENLRAVVCQYLLKRKDAKGRVLSAEVMICNEAIANLVRKGKTYQIPSIVTTSRDLGMQSMDNELMRLFRQGTITAEEAYMKAANKGDFEEIFNEEKKTGGLEVEAELTTGGEEPPPMNGAGGAG